MKWPIGQSKFPDEEIIPTGFPLISMSKYTLWVTCSKSFSCHKQKQTPKISSSVGSQRKLAGEIIKSPPHGARFWQHSALSELRRRRVESEIESQNKFKKQSGEKRKLQRLIYAVGRKSGGVCTRMKTKVPKRSRTHKRAAAETSLLPVVISEFLVSQCFLGSCGLVSCGWLWVGLDVWACHLD